MSGGRSAAAHHALEASLGAAMRAIAPAGLRLDCRLIRVGDEERLLPDERLAVPTRDPRARRASGAGRHAARLLLGELGLGGSAIGRERSGQPVWPEGIVGSIAHDDVVAVAAVGSSAAIAAVGIDVEPAEPLPDDLWALVVTNEDVPGQGTGDLAGRLVFAAKEACYKAAHRIEGVVLEHGDIAVDLARSRARTRTGIVAQLHWCAAPRIVVVAVVASDRF